jgi:CheY-like chemotaxis protein
VKVGHIPHTCAVSPSSRLKKFSSQIDSIYSIPFIISNLNYFFAQNHILAQHLLIYLSYRNNLMLRALVIDDDKLIRWSLQEIFSQEGHHVDTVATASDAIAQAEKSPYHLIFADMEIDNADSIEMLKKLQNLQPEAEIIILSAQTRQQIEQQIVDLPISTIIEKPFNSDQIRSIAQATLDLLNNEKDKKNKTEEV